jgi:hypothetical protein
VVFKLRLGQRDGKETNFQRRLAKIFPLEGDFEEIFKKDALE